MDEVLGEGNEVGLGLGVGSEGWGETGGVGKWVCRQEMGVAEVS